MEPLLIQLNHSNYTIFSAKQYNTYLGQGRTETRCYFFPEGARLAAAHYSLSPFRLLIALIQHHVLLVFRDDTGPTGLVGEELPEGDGGGFFAVGDENLARGLRERGDPPEQLVLIGVGREAGDALLSGRLFAVPRIAAIRIFDAFRLPGGCDGAFAGQNS